MGSNPTSDKTAFCFLSFFFLFGGFLFNVHQEETHGFTDSRVAQWKRAGPITQRSVDRNYPLLCVKFIRFVKHDDVIALWPFQMLNSQLL